MISKDLLQPRQIVGTFAIVASRTHFAQEPFYAGDGEIFYVQDGFLTP